MNINAIIEGLPRFIDGVIITVTYAGGSLLIGFFMAIPVALMRSSRNRFFYWFSTGYVTFFRGTPLLAQLFLVYYGAGQFHHELDVIGLWDFFREPWFCAIFTLTLNTTAYTSEIWRGGLQAIPKAEIEAARACGLSDFQLLRHIMFPRALGIGWPAYTNEVVYQIQATSLVSVISVMDITGVARSIASRDFVYYEAFLFAAALYLLLVYGFIAFSRLVEKKLHRHLKDTTT
ncbi:ABC transporter permease [Halomonas salipaludis]|uniref:Arginine ABC transporter permease protein ArtM n=1 Tax=Halomonas salipaludis TaxID=2032625 RepID=A0A2A2EWC2_9GAMM|nr:ABC transporter permease subunit [Halomonas salipaludis]PAU76860.1 ABC transporter permease [Halomonas salipaludis]